MQNTKDSFFIAVRDRLAILNPSRVVLIQGVSRPAILVTENELTAAAPKQANAFTFTGYFGVSNRHGAIRSAAAEAELRVFLLDRRKR